MNIVTFRNPQEKALGLQFLRKIPERTLFKFPGIQPGTLFHSRNVPEPFEIAFYGPGDKFLAIYRIIPPDGFVRAPEGTVLAVEAKPGVIAYA